MCGGAVIAVRRAMSRAHVVCPVGVCVLSVVLLVGVATRGTGTGYGSTNGGGIFTAVIETLLNAGRCPFRFSLLSHARSSLSFVIRKVLHSPFHPLETFGMDFYIVIINCSSISVQKNI
jgi:hypothetical protein